MVIWFGKIGMKSFRGESLGKNFEDRHPHGRVGDAHEAAHIQQAQTARQRGRQDISKINWDKIPTI